MGGYTPPTFTPPTAESVQNDPGYQFRLKSGTEALNRAAAAKGVLRTGGTLKDILSYGQDLGSQEYGNAFDRYMQQYGAQRQNAQDVYQAQLQQQQLAAMGRRGGGGEDFPPPPEAPDYGPPDDYGDPGAGGDPYGGGGDPYGASGTANPGGRPYGRDRGDYY